MRYERQLKTVLVKLHHPHTVSLPTAPTAGAIDANVMMVIELAQSIVRWTLPSEMIPDVTRNLLLAQQKSQLQVCAYHFCWGSKYSPSSVFAQYKVIPRLMNNVFEPDSYTTSYEHEHNALDVLVFIHAVFPCRLCCWPSHPLHQDQATQKPWVP